MKRFLKHTLALFLVIVMAIPVLAAKTSTCGNCGETCSYTLEYEQWGETYHTVRWWCSNCGEDMNMGGNAERHNFYHDYDTDYDVCDDCGYEIECECGEAECDHYDTYTEWDGCDWYEYCLDCDELLDEGTEHGSYEYDDWEYYTSSRHRRYYYCEDCGGDDGYEYDYHDADTEYYKYDSTQHEVAEYCYDCDSDIDSYYEDHSFSYASWSNYSSSQHRRSVSCLDCGYSGYEYANHSLIYGSLSSYSSTQHRRTATCSTCGYSSYEYANHSLTTGRWKSTSASQHSRTISCSCGYSTTETASHSLSYGAWTNYSSTQHKRTISCSTCGYSTTEYASHSLTNGSWASISDTEHSRTTSCSCGYSYSEGEDHDFTYGTWTSISDSEHQRSMTCDCGYSGTEYTDHNLVISDWKNYSDTQHFRSISCVCGYSLDEYAEHADTDDDGGCDNCTYITSRFSVTVPAFMTMVVSGDGEVYAATNAEIVNNSTAPIAVTDITITTDNGWTLVPYNTDMANEKVDSRQIGFILNGTDGFDVILANDGRWIAEKDSAIPLSYDAVVSATSEILTDEQVLTVIFVIGWAA